MSEKLDSLKKAIGAWHKQAKTELEAEASFLEAIKSSGDDVSIARYASGERFADLVADTIKEFFT